nr:MAG TPA: hypothetical protein [Caudoviricetes sp.]
MQQESLVAGRSPIAAITARYMTQTTMQKSLHGRFYRNRTRRAKENGRN